MGTFRHVVLTVGAAFACTANAAESLRDIRVRLERELLEDVIPFWETNSPDRQYGGFITCLDREGRPYDTFKQMWMQWRAVWMFAALHNSPYRREPWLKIAEDGFDFLYAHGRQPDGSYAYMLDRQGRVTALAGDGGSEVFNESFAAVACAELYLATKKEKYRAEALSAFAAYRRKTSAAEAVPPQFPARVVYRQLAYPMIALNVLTVMNRAFGGLDGDIAACMDEIRSFADPKTGLIHERRLPDGSFDHDTQDGRFINPGHTLEGLSFILARLREKPDAALQAFALEKVRTMGTFGWDDEQGGVRYFRDEQDKPVSRNEKMLKTWWPQAEAMTAMLRAYEATGERWYLDYFLRTDAFVTARLRDAACGEWFAYGAVDGRQEHSYKGSRYKGFFHIPRMLLDCLAVLKRLEAKEAAPSATWHVTGGTERFRSFLSTLKPSDVRLAVYPEMDAMPFGTATTNDVFFLLPAYERGEQVLREPRFECLPQLAPAMDRGAGFYFENYVTSEYAADGLHSDLTGLQVLGRPRNLFQEYVVDEGSGAVLQARDAFYLPANGGAGRGLLATVQDCVGTHKVSVKGKWRHPVLARGRTPRVVSAAFDLSRFDPLYRRPRREWRSLMSRAFSEVTGVSEVRAGEAFDTTFPEPLRLSSGTDCDEAVRRAVAWHFRSGLMRKPDGSAGMFEMVRSDDLGIRRSLRTDVTLLTGALLVGAGRKYGRADWERAGRRLVDFQLAQGAQEPGGFFRWYAGCDNVWASDASRDGLAMVNLYKYTGEKAYLESARRLGDAFLGWVGDEGACCGWFNLAKGTADSPIIDNPVFYGEMVSFLLQLGEEKYTAAACRIIDRVMAKFPDVTPFGFSDNFTYSRGLLMLACAQRMTDRDYSGKINRLMDFFIKLRHPCGGIGEAPIRLETSTEAGVGMGDGSDAISDILYCDNFVYGAASVLARLPPERRCGVDMEKARALEEGLKGFFLRTQIASDDPRFDGGWMRAYDMDREEYYGLNRDMEWGSYCIMGGWVMGFVPAILMNDGTSESWYFNRTDATR